MPSNAVTISGSVERLFFSNEKFSAGKLAIPNGKPVSFRAKFATAPGQHYTMRGAWVDDPKWGKQFDARELVYEMDTSASGLAHWLATNPAFFGIGPVKAGIIVREFGADFDTIIRTDPARVMRAAKLTASQIDTLQKEWIAGSERNALFTWLSQFELTHHQMGTLVETYGDRTRAVMENDPYILCREIRGYGFTRTDAIALKMGIPLMHPSRVRACIADIAYSVTNEGHCWIEARELLQIAENKLGINTLDDRATIKQIVSEMVSEHLLCVETIDGQGSLFANPAIYAAELFIADKLRTAPALDTVMTDTQFNHFSDLLPDLNDSQERAVRMALSSRICVIAGEAGTGKSYTINAIRRAFQLHDATVLLAAPTGKAAKRMEELCGAEAKTIHRLLGYDPSKQDDEAWHHHADNTLDCDVLILDEVGMLDILLARRVFEAVNFEETQLILVGDHAQLPPVGPGNLLRDLLPGKFCPVVILDQVMRQAGILKENSVHILHGGGVPDTTPGEPGIARPWYRLNQCDSPDKVLDNLLHIVEHELPKIGLADPAHWQVLSPQHQTAIGCVALNLHLQRLVQRTQFNRDLPIVIPNDRGKYPRAMFYPGDKIINTHNNYTLGVMNGAQGVVIAVDVPVEDKRGKVHEHGMEIDFGESTQSGQSAIIKFYGEFLDDLQLAYAMTVHKAQGSEYPCAIVICSKSHSFILSRNLLYTAVTRARKTCIIIGDHLAMRRAILNAQTAQRRTWLSVWDRCHSTDTEIA